MPKVNKGNQSERRGKGYAPRAAKLSPAVGSQFRDLAAALDLIEVAAAGEVGDAEELARLLGLAFQRWPVETLIALGPLVVKAGQEISQPDSTSPAPSVQ